MPEDILHMRVGAIRQFEEVRVQLAEILGGERGVEDGGAWRPVEDILRRGEDVVECEDLGAGLWAVIM